MGLGVESLLIYAVAVAAGIGLLYLALQQFGITIPPWVVRAFWIVIVAVGIIFCIKLVFSA